MIEGAPSLRSLRGWVPRMRKSRVVEREFSNHHSSFVKGGTLEKGQAQPHALSSIVPALAKAVRTGHPHWLCQAGPPFAVFKGWEVGAVSCASCNPSI